ncbi:MAG: (2Fe-2S)-binding protein [Spirochaetes bacterium]|nr:(2Fe-2S)-binding protein [Spirochaetota bacterium]
MKGAFIINGTAETYTFGPADTMLSVLRKNGHAEVKSGCGKGECGICIVLLDGKPVNSCQVLAASVIGREITTVMGIGNFRNLNPIQEAFVEAGGVQCGYCTPAKVVVTYSLLRENPDPSDADVRNALDGNICRCTGYVKILDSVKLAAKKLSGGTDD